MPVETRSLGSQEVVEEINTKEVCIIQKEYVEMMLHDSLKLQQNQTNIAEKISDTLVNFTNFLETSTGTMSSKLDVLNENILALNVTLKESSDALESKLDKVIEVLGNRPESLSTPAAEKFDIELTIRRRNSLVEKSTDLNTSAITTMSSSRRQHH